MATPMALIGQVNPSTGNPFGREISIGLETRRLTEARHKRDIWLGELRKLALGIEVDGRFSLERAEAWAEEITRQEADGDGGPDDLDIRSIVAEEIENAENLPPSKRPRNDTLKRFGRVALRTGYPIDDAVTRYLEERKIGNRQGLKPLSIATVNDVRTAVGYLKKFRGGGDGLCLQDIDRKEAQRFRYEFLAQMTTPRAPQGLAAKTVGKHITLLSGIWVWAAERGFTAIDAENPWKGARGIAKAKAPSQQERSLFTPEQVATVLRAFPHGHRLGDVFRLALVTGCRVDEIASLLVSDVEADVSGFTVRAGKTVNASRYVPLIRPAQGLLQARLEALVNGEARVFPEWPVRPSTGKSSALPAAFTRERRRLLGAATDGSLALHSTRHTWRTLARRAGVPEATINDLGGWAGQRTSSSVYDHGLLKGQLHQAQELIGGRLAEEGYLKAF
jgi:integrase